MLVHYTLAEDIRALKRVKDAMGQGKPVPMALREQRVWGNKERFFDRVLPRLSDPSLAKLLRPDWPTIPWEALARLATMLCASCAAASNNAGSGQARQG